MSGQSLYGLNIHEHYWIVTIGLCSVFEFINKKVDAKLERYYKLLGVSDGQPHTPKHYFFNDGTLTEKIHEFLALDVAKLKICTH